MKVLTSVALVVLASAVSANAGVILSPVAIVTNSAGEFAPGDAAHAIDQSGLSAGFTSGVTDFATYMASAPVHTFLYVGFEWFSSPGVNTGYWILDLGATYSLLHVADWNDEFSGLTSLRVSTCADAGCATPVGIGGGIPTNWPLSATSYPADVFDLSGASSRYVRIDMTGPQTDNLYNGLSIGEIAFDVAAPVPEPSTLLLIGAGALLAGIKRYRSARG